MIRKSSALFFFLVMLSVSALAQQPTQPPPAQTAPVPLQTHLKVGQPAPDFTLTNTQGKEVKLSDYKGKRNVVLAFYVLAFTPG